MKSVTFKVRNFAVPARKGRFLKHVIYAGSNIGFTAKRGGLESGYGIERLRMTTDVGWREYEEVILRQIDGTGIRRIFCFSTHQDGEIVNCIIIVTHQAVYFVPLFGAFTPRLIPNHATIRNLDCFAYAYTRDRDFIFAANSSGIFVADYSLVFEPLSTSIRNAKQMIVFDSRLFVLDGDGETIYFTEALDLLKFEGSVKVEQSFGKILSLEVYDGKLLLVCENGFKVMQTSFDSRKFRFQDLCRSYEEIIDGTAKALGDTIYFLTAGGMCQATRGRITQLDIDIGAGEEMSSIVYDNRYFLSNGEDMIVIERFNDSVTTYKGLQARGFERVFNEYTDRLAVLTNQVGLVFQIGIALSSSTPRNDAWETEDFALTYASGNQYIRQILIQTATNIDVVVISNRAEQRISVNGSPDVQKINLNLKGETFRIKLLASGEADISSLSVVVGF